MQQIVQAICVFWQVLDTNFFSSLVGGFLAAYLFWLLFQNRIKKFLDYKETKRLSGNLLGELLYNLIVANENVLKKDYYFDTKQLNVREYEVDAIAEFIKREPLELDHTFYKRLRVFYSALKQNNMFLRIHWFSPNLKDMDIATAKKNYLDNSNNVVNEITKILNNKQLFSQLRELGLTDDRLKYSDSTQ